PYSQAVETLARVKPLVFRTTKKEGPPGENVLVLVLKETEVVIPMSSMVDLAAEKQRLEKELAGNQAEAVRLEARLGDNVFLSRAPAAVVTKERDKLALIKDKLARLKQQLDRLQA
ncbi:MAG: valine--tRNA ligase, partial [Chloroflexi bacterium]|nr:valine--tRNA ligase [Chloroflexota bacterium]